MSCSNCGREGHVAKNCRQGAVCEKCGMKGHTENNLGSKIKVGSSRETRVGSL